MPYFRSRSRRTHLLRLLIFILFVLGIDFLRVRYRLVMALSQGESGRGRGRDDIISNKDKIRKERIFISSIHWNNEAVLRSHWNAAVVALTRALGPENVYVSIYESGSWDDTEGALRELDASLDELNVRRTIVLSDVSHKDEISQPPAPMGWIDTPRGRKELRRIPFLSRQRNASLQPLADLDREHGEQFDLILFLNDVVFKTDDFFTLLDTHDGDYAAACSLDFSKPPDFYDTFALRDLEGHEPLMQTWPYFRSRDSRWFIERGEPAPVASCWNGMVIMDATPFYDSINPLRFRGISDSLATTHLEGSECCLIHVDNPLSSQKGVWLNPNVRVGYSGPAYESVHRPSSSSSSSSREEIEEHAHVGWLSTSQILWGLWENRLRRWLMTDAFKTWVVRSRLRTWAEQDPSDGDHRAENGGFCLINEMQVLVANGWAHV